MNTKILIMGVIEIFISMLFTVFIIWVSYRVLNKLVFRGSKEDAGNQSVAILLSSVLLSMGLLISETADPVMNAFRLLLAQDLSYQAIFLKLLRIMAIYMGLALFFGLLVNAAGIVLFTTLTQNINEWKAIRENNISVALVTAVIIIVLTLSIREGMGLVLESWVPYPKTPRFY
jgi:uncharacterized membrane protein YjfL (UPF0719 family)